MHMSGVGKMGLNDPLGGVDKIIQRDSTWMLLWESFSVRNPHLRNLQTINIMSKTSPAAMY